MFCSLLQNDSGFVKKKKSFPVAETAQKIFPLFHLTIIEKCLHTDI